MAPCQAEYIDGRVVKIADGDTITILDGNNVQHRIRLAGIDSPERNQPFGNRSRQNIATLVFEKTVRIEAGKKDRYGRWVGKVLFEPEGCNECDNLIDANLEQIRAGLAWWYQDYAHEQTVEDQSLYELAEKEARLAEMGLWAEHAPVAPWDWRKGAVSTFEAPTGCVIKGNINRNGERIYHAPERRSYTATKIDISKGERWFCSEGEALAAGWRSPN